MPNSYSNYEPLDQYSNRYMFVLAAQSKPPLPIQILDITPDRC